MRHFRTAGFSRAVLATALVLSAEGADAEGWPQVALRRRLGGLSNPVHIAHANDRSGRLFVVEQRGRIRIVANGALRSAPFLDISDRVSCCGERGLLSVAFPPTLTNARHFYVDYTDRNGDTVISRFRVSAGDRDVADVASEQVLLWIPQPYANHNGGQLAFGPDGLLYIGMGDGGSAGDPQNNAQNPATLLGKLLRIDVEGTGSPYSIPPSNPFVGNPAYRPEIWALGLRNPWRFSFDRRTRDLWIGDVGQSKSEEVDFQPASSPGGENYGWRIMEGTACYNTPSCNSAGLVPPVTTYPHVDSDCSVTGGFRYRGLSYEGLYGIYFFADYCTGRLRGVRPTGTGWETHEFLVPGFSVSTFGEDEAGELYLADYTGGALYQVTGAGGASSVLTVPVVVDTLGAGGAHFTSELMLGNRGTTPVSLAVTYTPAASLGASGGGTVTESLAAGHQETIPDAVAWLRQKGLPIPDTRDQGGTLRIVATGASAGDVVFSAVRTTAPSGSGRAGLAYPALSLDDVADSSVILFGLRESADFRSNVALVNAADPAGGSTSVFRVTLTSGDPADVRSVALSPLTLAAGQWLQLNQVLRQGGMTNGWATVERIEGKDPFAAYAVVNDNLTNDGSFVPAVPAGRTSRFLMLPVAVAAARFATEGVLTNLGTTPLTLRAGNSGPISLGPGEQRFVPDFLPFSGSAGGSPANAVPVRTETGLAAAFLAGARTFAPAPGGGSFGLFYAAVPFEGAATSEAWIYGLRQDGLVRSNLAFSNVESVGPAPPGATSPLALSADLFDGTTGLLAGSIGVSLDGSAPDWKQLNAVLSGFGLSNGYARIRAGSPGGRRFTVYGVVNDGGAPGLGTSDGSYLTMSQPLAPSPFPP